MEGNEWASRSGEGAAAPCEGGEPRKSSYYKPEEGEDCIVLQNLDQGTGPSASAAEGGSNGQVACKLPALSDVACPLRCSLNCPEAMTPAGCASISLLDCREDGKMASVLSPPSQMN